MAIGATCLTIAAALAAARGGETIALRGDCPAITIGKAYARPVTVDAEQAKVRGLTITGSNIRWKSGTITAPGGTHGRGPSGYAATVKGQSVTFDGVTFTDAKKGVVIDSARDVGILRSRFTSLGDDGIVAARTSGLTIDGNSFEQSVGKPTECLVDGRVSYGVARRSCSGTWKDGYHPDAVQMRNAVTDALLQNNVVSGSTQGLTQMDTKGDLPLERVVIRRNKVITDGYHPITLGNCIDCRIEDNEVRRAPGSAAKKVIHAGKASRCGNVAQDEKTRDRPCAKGR